MLERSTLRLLTLVLTLFIVAALPAQADFRLERELAMAADGTFEIDADAGAIEVRGTDRANARILVTARRDDVEERYSFSFEERGNDAVVRIEKRGGWTSRWFSSGKDRLRYTVEVPRRADIDLRTAGGAIEAEAIGGRADLHSSGGSISITQVDGDVDAHTSGGAVRAHEVRGNVSLDTSGGSIEAEGIAGDLTAKSSGGAIRASDVGGNARVRTSGGSVEVLGAAGAVEAHTSGGPVRASFTPGNASGGTLSSSGGGITASVDPAVPLDVDAHTSGGRVTVDLPITASGSFKRNAIRGELNGGGSLLKLRSSGGSIRVKSL